MSVVLDVATFDAHWADLFAWRNDPATRASALSGDAPVSLDEHVKWLRTAVINPNMRLFVARDTMTGRVGTGRLVVRDATTFEVAITVAPSHRGQGYGQAIVRNLIADADRPTLVAVVKDSNYASLRLFAACGFAIQKLGKGARSGLVDLVYTRP